MPGSSDTLPLHGYPRGCNSRDPVGPILDKADVCRHQVPHYRAPSPITGHPPRKRAPCLTCLSFRESPHHLCCPCKPQAAHRSKTCRLSLGCLTGEKITLFSLDLQEPKVGSKKRKTGTNNKHAPLRIPTSKIPTQHKHHLADVVRVRELVERRTQDASREVDFLKQQPKRSLQE